MPDGQFAPIGHNSPPPYRAEILEAHQKKAAEFLDAAGEWLDLKEIGSAEQASELNDFIAGVKKVGKAVDEDRKTDKKPHDDAGKKVQAAYSPILDKMRLAIDRVTPMQTRWLTKVEAERQAEAARKQAEAEAAAREAEEAAAKAAARNDISGEVDAEAAQKRAKELQKDAARAAKSKANVKSATGGARTASLRTTWRAKITNLRIAFMQFADEPELQELLVKLAERRARASDFDPEAEKIPGFGLTPVKSAV